MMTRQTKNFVFMKNLALSNAIIKRIKLLPRSSLNFQKYINAVPYIILISYFSNSLKYKAKGSVFY